ncbi:tyrosine-type recombinase/integrase [Curtobacterium citreum]
MASIQARSRTDGTVSYRVQYRLNGKMTSKSFADPGGAKQFSDQIDRVGAPAALAVWESRQGRTVGVPIFRDWAATYLDEASGYLTGVQADTRKGYESIVSGSLNPILGDIPVDAITKSDVGRWISWQESQKSKRRKDQNVSAKTMKNYHALLSAILTGSVEAGHRPDNPAHKARLSRGQKHEAVFLTRNEFAVLLHFVPEYYKPFVAFLAASGTRYSEATAFEKRDIDIDSPIPTARVTKAWKKDGTMGPPKSDRSRRTVVLFPEIASYIPTAGEGSALLFQGVSNHGRLWYGPFKSRIWDESVKRANDTKLCAAAGLEPLGKRPTPHDMRHTHASWLIAGGASLPEVQAQLGHEKITTTVDIYGHLMPEARPRMAAIMQRSMSHVLPSLEA